MLSREAGYVTVRLSKQEREQIEKLQGLTGKTSAAELMRHALDRLWMSELHNLEILRDSKK